MSLPKEVLEIIKTLNKEGYKAHPVGGCVRDLLIKSIFDGKTEPKDWDIATDARPEKLQEIFADSVYENNFGTVAVKTGNEADALKIVEITTFRTEGKYSDKRRPDDVKFAETIEEDLARRDFTVNAMALTLKNLPETPRTTVKINDFEIIDPFGGREDLKRKLIRTVGNPNDRLQEDALRLMRAVRFAVQMDFEIEEKTALAIKNNAELLKEIAKERIRDELVKIIMADIAERGIRLLEELGLMEHIVPELREGIGCSQAKHHIYTVWEHNVRSLGYAAEKKYSLAVRLSALLHDVGKPRTKKGEGNSMTFHNHEVVGGKMTKEIMERLRFPRDLVKKVTHFVRQHLFYYDIGEVTEAGVRRFVRRVGSENIEDLIKVREADRIGSGVAKAISYRLRHFLYMIEKVSKDPITVSMLEIDGNDIMKELDIVPGPRIGLILNALLEEVIDNPDKNEKRCLMERVKELNGVSDKELESLASAGKEKLEEKKEETDKTIRKKYYIK